MKKIYALFMMLCLVLSATAAPLAGSVKKSYPLYPQEVVKAKLSLETSMQKAPAATQGLQYDATTGALVRYYNETDVMEVNTDYIANGQVYIDVMAADYSDYLSLLLFVEGLEDGKIPAGTYPITSEPAYGTAYASQGYSATQGVIPCAYYPLVIEGGQLYISTPMYFMVSGSVTVEYVGEDLKVTVDAVNSNDIAINVVYEVGGKSEKVAVKTPLKYDATEGALDVTYGTDAIATATDKGVYGTLQVMAPDASNMLALLFFYPEGVADAETTIPVGTYTISSQQAAGNVLASTGVSSSGSVGYSFYANLNASGNLVTPIYFLLDGTVEVTKVDGQIKVEVNATNSNDVPIHVVYNTIPEVVEPVMETVYFVNAQSWTGTINTYAWTTDPNAAWPGAAAVKEAEQIGGYDVYSYTAEQGAYANVIFNNGSGKQTADLVWTAGKYYVLDGWYTKEEAEAKLVAPIVDEVVYFVNNKGWKNIKVYAWDPANASWPGVAATKEAEQIGGYDVYSYAAAPGTYQKVIFNGDGGQTADMVWTAGKYIVNNKWYTKEEAVNALGAPVVTVWTMVGDAALFGTAWDLNAEANDLVKQNDGSWVLTLENKTLAAKSYEYKAAKDRAWTTTVPGGDNAKLTISKAGQYNVVFTLNAATTSVTAKATIIPAKYTVTVTAENGTVTGAGEYEEGAEVTLVATANDGYEFVNWTKGEEVVSTEATYTFTITENVALVANFQEQAPEYALEETVEISNLTTETLTVGEATYLQLTGRNDMLDSDVMLFLNNYTGEDKEYEVNAENSLMTFGGIELTVVEGKIAQAQDTEKGAIYTGRVIAKAEEEGEVLLVALDLVMYSTPAVEVVVEGATARVDEETGVLVINGEWTNEGITYPVFVTVAGYEDVEFKEYEGAQISELQIGDDVNWLDFAVANLVAVVKEDLNVSVEGKYTSWATGATYSLMITGALPEVEKPEPVEPVYEENTLNPYAFGLESVLSEDLATLTVTYRLNNSNATSVDVVVYNGEEVVATVAGTTTIGVNTVEVATADLPAGVELTWAVQVNGTSVEVPTQETKMYNLYCPHGLAIDKNPESEYFGRILVADAMELVKDKIGYLGYGVGAGLHVFNPSFTTDSTVYKGGNDFTRILASNGYQPWRVKISEDGRIFVSSLDLNGVVVWEVSKDLQTWTPVIAGTNDATDYNIYDADGNFVAGPNCSMDVVGSGENLKLLLYSTNNKGIAFNQSGYRLDEYALGTATTWEGTPTNIINGGAYGLVHTNVEWIYDGEGGYWFGGSRAGNAGQPNLVHINAQGVQDYYTEDAGLYGGDGVLVHNGLLFKGKARSSSTVGNFGVWTIGKDEAGNTTLTEKWSVVANGIGRNLNEFAVDYAENLYVVGNSGEKIIAYALPYSGVVETPAAKKYAFELPKIEMVGTVKRAVQNGSEVIVLTHEADGTAHIYNVVNGVVKAELSQEGVIAVDPENAGDLLAISDIAITEDGKLVAINKIVCQAGDAQVDAGYKRGETRVYIWNDLAGAPSIWFTSKMASNWYRSVQGHTMAYKGTSTNGTLVTTGITATGNKFRYSVYNVIDGVYTDPAVNDSEHYHYTKGSAQTTDNIGANYEINFSLLAENTWVLDGELIDPFEITDPLTYNTEVTAGVTLNEDLGKKYNGASYVTVGEDVLMVAPFANPDGQLVGVEILNITNGFDAPQYVNMVYVDEAVAVEAAATAVQVVEGGLNITLVADATLYSFELPLGNDDDKWQLYEDAITNLVIDYDNMLLIGGPSEAFQVEVVLSLGDYDRNTDNFALLPESSISVLGSEATFIDGIASVDGIAQTALAVVHCMWNGMALEFHLTMSAAALEATVVVVENAKIEIEKYLLWGDMYDYSLKMTGEWLNDADGLTYPVLVEVPVYYPEATESYTIFSTVTVGGMGDEDPWLGFGEGDLTITQEGNTITATGIAENSWAGIAIDITISGTITDVPDGVENVTVTVKAVKMIKNGQLIISKDGKEFNAQGAVVK